MTWTQIAKSHLAAAKSLIREYPRSAASRAYYAAHAALTEELLKAGYVPPAGRQTPPHQGQAALIGQWMRSLSPRVTSDLRSVVRRLYARRIDADYRRTVTVDASAALDAVRDASTMFLALGVR